MRKMSEVSEDSILASVGAMYVCLITTAAIHGPTNSLPFQSVDTDRAALVEFKTACSYSHTSQKVETLNL